MRFVPSNPLRPTRLGISPRATARVRTEPSHLHSRQQSLRCIWSVLEMVGVGVTMAAFMAVAMF